MLRHGPFRRGNPCPVFTIGLIHPLHQQPFLGTPVSLAHVLKAAQEIAQPQFHNGFIIKENASGMQSFSRCW